MTASIVCAIGIVLIVYAVHSGQRQTRAVLLAELQRMANTQRLEWESNWVVRRLITKMAVRSAQPFRSPWSTYRQPRRRERFPRAES